MNKLNQKQKRYLCTHLGAGATVLEVNRMFYIEFGFQISLQQVMTYNPTKASGKRLSAALQKVFYDARAAAASGDDLAVCEMNHAAIRQLRLDDLYHEVATLRWAEGGKRTNIKEAVMLIEASRRNELTMATIRSMKEAPGATATFVLIHDPLAEAGEGAGAGAD